MLRKSSNRINGLSLYLRPKKKVVVFQVPCQKKTGSVDRLYFFFFFLDKTYGSETHLREGPIYVKSRIVTS